MELGEDFASLVGYGVCREHLVGFGKGDGGSLVSGIWEVDLGRRDEYGAREFAME